MLKVYACGGAGVNIGKNILPASANVIFVDTSKSNLKDVKNDNIFLLEEMDGAGKERAFTYENFKDIAGNVLIKHNPSDELNIVITSLSGGSGSVIGPMLARELATMNKNVITIAFISTSSAKEIDNSIKTLMTFKSLAAKSKKAMALMVLDNRIGRSQVDKKIIQTVNLFSLIIDKSRTEEFDMADLKNFINFDKVTQNAPCASVIDIAEKKDKQDRKGEHTVATIHVTSNKESDIDEYNPEYLATCILTEKDAKEIDIRIDNLLGAIDNIITDCQHLLKTFEDNKKVKNLKDKVVVEDSDDGIVL